MGADAEEVEEVEEAEEAEEAGEVESEAEGVEAEEADAGEAGVSEAPSGRLVEIEEEEAMQRGEVGQASEVSIGSRDVAHGNADTMHTGDADDGVEASGVVCSLVPYTHASSKCS